MALRRLPQELISTPNRQLVLLFLEAKALEEDAHRARTHSAAVVGTSGP
jgi:hypothetical protein